MRLLVTGAAGFIGSNFVRLLRRERPEYYAVVLDALTYAGNLSTIQDLVDSGVKFYPGKIQDSTVVEGVIQAERITHIVNFAAESHNDRSIVDPIGFIQTDVQGVFVLLEATRKFHLKRMLQVSTDEVYGTVDTGSFTEQSPIQPNTPYSASKAGGDLQARSYFKTFGTPVVLTRGGNTYGPFQYPEKLIPFFVTRLIDEKKIPVYGDGTQVREWIHVDDHAAGILCALERGTPGEIYNVGDVNERQNRDIVRLILRQLGRGDDRIKHIEDPRKGAHDKRYSMDSTKLQSLGWTPKRDFADGLNATINWYSDHEEWWRPIVATEGYRNFISGYYGRLLGNDL